MKKHFNNAKDNQNSQKILFSRTCPKDYITSFYSSSLSLVQRVEDVQKLDCPLNNEQCLYIVLCCCDGLALLWSSSELLLWNPSTGESIVLPDPEFSMSSCTYGMGYDSTSDDYKILKIEKYYGPAIKPSEILKLKSGSWRKIDEHPRSFCYKLASNDSFVLVHGAFHWIGMDVSFNYYVVSFSISDEVYGEIPLPDEIRSIFNVALPKCGISILGGLICAYCSTHRDAMMGTFKLWVMKNYGVKKSWTELFTIRDTYLYTVIPKHMFADGEVLFYYEESQTHGFKTSKGPFGLWPKSPTFLQGFDFTESLISPKSLT